MSGSHAALFVGLATALGAGIGMAFSEGLSDTGEEAGHGSAFVRGGATGVMTYRRRRRRPGQRLSEQQTQVP